MHAKGGQQKVEARGEKNDLKNGIKFTSSFILGTFEFLALTSQVFFMGEIHVTTEWAGTIPQVVVVVVVGGAYRW